jgi:Fuc2NAc and GlcNAc transferase
MAAVVRQVCGGRGFAAGQGYVLEGLSDYTVAVSNAETGTARPRAGQDQKSISERETAKLDQFATPMKRGRLQRERDVPFSIVFAGVLSLLAGVISYLVTRQIAAHAEAMGLVQAPNSRSSHKLPTPSGGGLAFVIGSVATGAMISIHEPSVMAILAISAAAGALGFVDDLTDLRAALRFPIHIVLVVGLVWLCMPYPSLPLPLGWSAQGIVLGVGLSLAGVWWINLFNFMDGIDGLAGSQAVLILAGTLGLWLSQDLGGVATPLFWSMLATGVAVLGFMVSNWPPARIFMGDVGSNFLAASIFALLLSMIALGVIGYGTALILVSVLVSDTTVTLVRRVVNGEKPWTAHRRHAYQQLSRRLGHAAITLAYGTIQALWVLPLASLSVVYPRWELPFTVLAVVPLVALAAYFGGGARTEYCVE